MYHIYPQPLEAILTDAACEVYNAIGADVGLETMSTRQFVSVVLDHLFIAKLTKAERDAIWSRSRAWRERIVARVQ